MFSVADLLAEVRDELGGLRFHAFKVAWRDFAREAFPDCKAALYIGVAAQRLRFSVREDALTNQQLQQVTKHYREGRKLAFDLWLASWKEVELLGRIIHN